MVRLHAKAYRRSTYARGGLLERLLQRRPRDQQAPPPALRVLLAPGSCFKVGPAQPVCPDCSVCGRLLTRCASRSKSSYGRPLQTQMCPALLVSSKSDGKAEACLMISEETNNATSISGDEVIPRIMRENTCNSHIQAEGMNIYIQSNIEMRHADGEYTRTRYGCPPGGLHPRWNLCRLRLNADPPSQLAARCNSLLQESELDFSSRRGDLSSTAGFLSFCGQWQALTRNSQLQAG